MQGTLSSPPPPTPDQLRSIQHVCKTRNVIIPNLLRSIQHVCKCKECYHPPPHPPLTSCVASNMCAKQGMWSSPTSCVASNMCASARNVIIPPPHTPDQLRSIQHVCKCKECYHPPPPPTPDQLRNIQHVCKRKECYHPPPHPPLTSCVASNMCAKWGEMWKCAQKPTAFCEPWANYSACLLRWQLRKQNEHLCDLRR